MPRGTGHGQVKGLASTYSKDGKGNRFRYQNFGERVAKARFEARVAPRQVDIYHERKEDEDLCYFKEELKRWSELNLTLDFKEWARKIYPLVQTLPQLIHHLDKIVGVLVTGIKTVSELSLEPLFGLTAILARDLRGEILPYFKEIFLAIVGLMDNSKPELMGQIFQTLSVLFKYLSKEMLRDLKSIRELYFGLLTSRRDHIRSFAAESWAFLLRKLKGKELRAEVRIIISALTIDALESPAVKGIGRVLFEIVRGSQHSLHSNAADVMQAAFMMLRKGLKGEKGALAIVRYDALSEALNEICEQTSRQNFHVVWKCMLEEAEYVHKKWGKTKNKNNMDAGAGTAVENASASVQEKSLQMARILNLIQLCLDYRNGTRLSTSTVYPGQLAGLLHRLFVEDSQLTFRSTKVSMAALKLLLALCNWFPASDTVAITRLLPDIFYNINANKNAKNIGIIHSFYENVLEKSYSRPKIFRILIVPSVTFYDVMHSISDRKNSYVALNMLYKIGKQTTNLADNRNFDMPMSAVNNHGKLQIKQSKLTQSGDHSLYSKIVNILQSLAGLSDDKIKQYLGKEADISSPRLAKEAYATIRLFPYIVLNDPTEVLHLLGSFVSSLDNALLAHKSISSHVMEQLYVLKAKCIGATINLSNGTGLPQIYNVGNRRTEILRWGLLDPIASKNSVVLETMSLFLSSSHGSRDLQDIVGLEDAVGTLKPNLASKHHTVRVSTLEILARFPRLNFLMPEKGEEKNFDDGDHRIKGPCNIIDLLLQCEQTPLDLENERQRAMLVDKVGAMIRSKCVPKIYTSLVMHFVLGMLFVKYSRMWPTVNSIFPVLAKADWETFWKVLYHQLLEVRERNLSGNTTVSADENVHNNHNDGNPNNKVLEDETTSSHGLEGKTDEGNKNDDFNDIINLHTDYVKYEELLFEALHKISSYVEKKCAHMFPMFENFLEMEYDKLEVRTKDSTRKLILFLKLFSTFSKRTVRKHAQVTEKIYHVYNRFLSNTNEEISLWALRCIFTYGVDGINSYKAELERIASEKSFREQMSSFSLSRSNKKLKENARPRLMPILIRLSYGKLMTRKGKSGKDNVSSRRATVLTFLSGLDMEELNELYDLLLEPFVEVLQDKLSIIEVNNTKQMGFVRMMEDVIEQLGTKVTNRLTDMSIVLTKILYPLVRSHHQGEDLGNAMGEDHSISNELKMLRSQSFKRLSEIFLNFPTFQHDNRFLDVLRDIVVEHVATIQKTVIGQSATASSFLELILSFSYSESVSTLMFSHKHGYVLENTVKAISQCSNDSRNPSINYIFDILENILEKNVPVIEPHIPTVLEEFYARFKNIKDNLKNCKRDLNILSRIGHVMIDRSVAQKRPETKSVCSKVISLLVPFLRSQHRLSDEVKCDILDTIHALACLVDDMSEHVGLMSRLFVPGNGMLTRNSRTKLVKLFVHLGNLPQTKWLKDASVLLQDLVAYDEHTIDSYDFDKRLRAMTLLSKNSLEPYTCKPPCVQGIIYQVLKSMHDEDFSLRQAACRVMNNFVRFVGRNSNQETDKVYVVETVVVPQIKEGLKSRKTAVRKGFLLLLREIAKSFDQTGKKKYPLLHLDLKNLFDKDSDQDIFANLMHVQPHRRARALARLRDRIDVLEANTITSIFLPMIMHNLHEAKKDTENVLIQESIRTIEAIASTLPWSRYSNVLRMIMSQIQKYPDREKLLIKSVEGVVDAFHFDMSDAVQKFLVDTLLPMLNAFLVEKSEDSYAPMQALRVPIALSVVKVLKKLPQGALEEHLRGLLSTICDLLKSKEQRTRNEAKTTLVRLLEELGVEYVDNIITELRRSLKEGFMLHVLGNVMQAMLVSLPENVNLDKSAVQIVEVMTEDIFGDVAKQRNKTSGYVPSKDILEAQSCKSYSTYEVLAARITFKGYVDVLTKPLENVGRRDRPTAQCKEVLKHLTIGLSRNPTIVAKDVVEYSLDLINKHIDEHTGYEDLWIGYAVDLLNMALKRRIITSKTAEHRRLLDRCVKDLVHCCQKCKSNYVLSASLKCLSSMITWDLPAIKAAVQDILDQIFRMLRLTSSGAGGQDVRQSCFRTIALLLRKTKLEVSDARMRVIISLAEADLHHMLSQNATFSLIKAILFRRIILGELYDLVTKITKLMITSLKPAVRNLCSQVFMEFLEKYPMGNKRREEHVNALLKNLSYSFEIGRLSALNMLEKIIKKSNQSAVNAQAKTFFVQMVLRLVNEDVESCREKISEVMLLLMTRVGAKEFDEVMEMAQQWINVSADGDEKRLMAVAGLQCYGFGVESRAKLMQKYTAAYTKKFCTTHCSSPASVHWEITYHALIVAEKILIHSCKAGDFISEASLDAVVAHMCGEHPWVRTVSMRITRHLMTSTNILKFKHEDMSSTMATLAQENLMLLSHLYASSNDANGLTDTETGDNTSGKDPVNWAIHRLSYCVRGMKTEAIPARHGILGWFIELAAKYPKQIIKSIGPVLACTYRLATASRGQQNIAKETITLAQEVMDSVQSIMDEEVYTTHVEELRKEIFTSRQARKRKRELEKITDPEAAAARRMKRNKQKGNLRKRKMEDFKKRAY